MDLGLSKLTDDQLLELVKQACVELTARDPYMRNMAQLTITTEAERLDLQRKLLREAAAAVAGAYVEQIRKETFEEVREAVRNGTIRLLTPAQEARVLVDGAIKAKIKLIDETAAAIQGGRLKPKEADYEMRKDIWDLQAYRDPIAIREARMRQQQEEEMARREHRWGNFDGQPYTSFNFPAGPAPPGKRRGPGKP